MNEQSRIFLAGHDGLVGRALARRLAAGGYGQVITRSRSELDLTDQRATREFFAAQSIDCVLLAAARVGGILANDTYPADFIRDNLLIQTHVVAEAHRGGVSELLFLGSSCIYPRHAPQPMKEEHLLTGHLEPTNSAYAVAKIAGIEMCQAYARQHGLRSVSVMPTNLYGPGDNFDPETSHVLPALIRRFHEAKVQDAPAVTLWGTGEPLREFLHVDDLADACVFLMEAERHEPLINVGSGEEVSIADLAGLIAEVVGFSGRIEHDTSKPDGTPRKLLDVSLLRDRGWRPRVALRQGVATTYRWYLDHIDDARASHAPEPGAP